jgi:hypothetical protein
MGKKEHLSESRKTGLSSYELIQLKFLDRVVRFFNFSMMMAAKDTLY